MSSVFSKLPKKQHIKSNSYFSQLMRKGQKVHAKYFTCYFVVKRYGTLRLGVTCSKQTPNAVMRNYYKRRMRLTFQANAVLFSELFGASCDVILVAKHTDKKIAMQDYINDFAESLQKYMVRDKIKC